MQQVQKTCLTSFTSSFSWITYHVLRMSYFGPTIYRKKKEKMFNSKIYKDMMKVVRYF